MKTRKLLFLYLLVLTAIFTACNSDDTNHDSGSVVELPQQRAFVLNQGTMTSNNAGIAFFDYSGATTTNYNDIYSTQNSVKLGDTAQSIITYNNDIYVCVSTSKYIVRLNAAGVLQSKYVLASTDGYPRYLASANGYIYVTLYGGVVVKLNATSLQEEARLQTGGANLEGLVKCGNYLYAADSYSVSNGNYTYLTNVYVIDPSTFKVIKTVTVSANPNYLTVANGKVFVVSFGNYSDIGYKTQVIDPSDNFKVTDIATATNFAANETDGIVYYVNSVTDWSNYPNVSVVNTFFSYNANTGALINSTFLNNAPVELSSSSISMIAVNPYNGDIYIGTTLYAKGNGTLYQFKKDGTYVGKRDSGGQGPCAMAFFNFD